MSASLLPLCVAVVLAVGGYASDVAAADGSEDDDLIKSLSIANTVLIALCLFSIVSLACWWKNRRRCDGDPRLVDSDSSEISEITSLFQPSLQQRSTL